MPPRHRAALRVQVLWTCLFESLPISDGQLTLLYRASPPRDVVFRAELEDIAQRRGAQSSG